MIQTEGHPGRVVRADRLKAKLLWVGGISTVLTVLVTFAGVAATLPLLKMNDSGQLVAALVMISVFAASYWCVTRFYSRPSVRCPVCTNSLWDYANDNVLLKRFRNRSAVMQCPHCGTPIQ
jgi:steroid 5-alpha reductase family enzyme